MSLNSKATPKRKRKHYPRKRMHVYHYYETTIRAYLKQNNDYAISLPKKDAKQLLYYLRMLYQYLRQDSLVDDESRIKLNVMDKIWMHLVDDPSTVDNFVLKLEPDPVLACLPTTRKL